MKLLDNEEILISAKRHWISLIPAFIPLILISIFYFLGKAVVDNQFQQALEMGDPMKPFPSYFKWIVIGIFFLFGVLPILNAILRRISEKLIVTNMRIIGKQGIFNTVELNSLTKNIYSITLSSSLSGKIFNYGTIIIVTNSTYKYEYVSGAKNFNEKVIELQNS